jgi:hypothetical protein
MMGMDLESFGQMMGMFKGGMNPQSMMGAMGNPRMTEAFKWAQEQCKDKNAEKNLRNMFKENGLDLDSMRKQFGV